MKDRTGSTLHEGELVRVLNHPEEYFSYSWMVITFIPSLKHFVLQHFDTKEIRIFPQSDVERTYPY